MTQETEIQQHNKDMVQEWADSAEYHQNILKSIRRDVTAPLKSEQIREFFENKDLFYMIDYNNSTIKGTQFLVFVSNLELPCDLVLSPETTYEEYAELMLAFMKQSSITRMSLMHVLAVQMLLRAKGIPFNATPYQTVIPEEYAVKFIEANAELVGNWLNFIDSTPVFAIQSIQRLREHYKPDQVFEVIDDRLIVGPNIATLFAVPDFIGIYFTTEKYRLSYYKQQFEEYIFKGQRLVTYFDNKNNLAAILFSHYANGVFSADEVENAMFKIGVFDPKLGLPEYKFDPLYSVKAPDDISPDEAVQDGQPIVNEASTGESVSSEPQSGSTEGV